MSNELDETRDPVNEQGRDIHVIEKSLPITIDWRSKVFTFFLWFPLVIPGIVFGQSREHPSEHCFFAPEIN